jgi:hypothetical protein
LPCRYDHTLTLIFLSFFLTFSYKALAEHNHTSFEALAKSLEQRPVHSHLHSATDADAGGGGGGGGSGVVVGVPLRQSTARLERIIAAIDRDNSGNINVWELELCLQIIYTPVDSRELARVFCHTRAHRAAMG